MPCSPFVWKALVAHQHLEAAVAGAGGEVRCFRPACHNELIANSVERS